MFVYIDTYANLCLPHRRVRRPICKPATNTLPVEEEVPFNVASATVDIPYTANPDASFQTMATASNEVNNNSINLEYPPLHDDGVYQRYSKSIEVPQVTVADGAAASNAAQDFNTNMLYTPPYSIPFDLTPTKYFEVNRHQLQDWLYQISSSEMSLAERLEKENWVGECSRL